MRLTLNSLATRVVLPSVTYWYRLEPRPRGTSLSEPTAAPVRDPLWFLTRQWQMGEFLGADAGSPAYTQIASASGKLTNWSPAGAAPQPIPANTPLEPLIEREPLTPNLALSVELGQIFEQVLIEGGGTPAQRDAFRAAFPLQLPFDADPDAARFFSVCSGRAVDGIALLNAIQTGAVLPAAPAAALTDFQTWVADAFGPIGATDPASWNAKQLQYDVRVQGTLPQNTAGEFSALPARDGAFDWFAFDLQSSPSAPVIELAAVAQQSLRVIPIHVRFRGMPNGKWWDFENNVTDFGGIDVQRHELAKLAVMDFLLVHGNDWFVVPIEMPVNSIYRIDSFLVRDVFGTLTVIQRTDGVLTPSGNLWTMFSTVIQNAAQNSNDPAQATPVAAFFLLPPTAAVAMQSGFIIEDLRFLRDPTANMDWVIEHQIEGGIGQPLMGAEEDARKRLAAPQAAATQSGAVIRYQIESSVPRDWFPFVPVATGNVVSEVVLRLGELLPDSHGLPILPRGRILPPIGDLREQEIPRTGLRLTRVNMRTRWLDGSTHSWIARRRLGGKGEGSSGLKFDLALPQLPSASAAPPLVTTPSQSGTVGAVLESGGDLIAPRFAGDDVFASCLSGHRIFAGSGDPAETVARIQQALADLGLPVTPDGIFGPQTGAAVTQYKTGKGISPNDPVVGPQTAAALDGDFAHELFDAKAATLAGSRFDLGARLGTRVDVSDGVATCAFENGIGVEVGHIIAYGMPSAVASAWLEAGGATGNMGLPSSDPFAIDATLSAQEFDNAVRIFGGASDFTWPRDAWEAWVAAQGTLGSPTGPLEPLVTVQFDPDPVFGPQVVVKVFDAIPVNIGAGGSLSLSQLGALVPGSEAVVTAIAGVLPDVSFRRHFEPSTPEEIVGVVASAVTNDPTYKPPNFENFLEVTCPAGFDTAPLIAAFKLWTAAVEVAYAVAPSEPATVVGTTNPLFPFQGYLSAAPAGIGVQKAWATGADGTGIGLIDVEHGWFLKHEDLPTAITLLGGAIRRTGQGHGTAVLGVIAAVDNTTGVVGIAPAALIRLLGVLERASNLDVTTDRLHSLIFRSFIASWPGDILLLEVQASGGRPLELIPAVFAAIRLNVARGIIVVEPAGNGGFELDAELDEFGHHALSRTLPAEFRDSGAMLVGASQSALPHDRLAASCHGSRIDCYAWGEHVRTTGRRQDPVRPNDYFDFSGTSAAAAIIAGVCILMQQLQRIKGSPAAPLLTPAQMRSALSDPANGTASGSPPDRIGVMPDFAKLLVNEFI